MEAKTFCLSLTSSHKNPDNATVGLVVANAAIGCDKETTLFLSCDGVWLAKPGEAEKIAVGGPFAGAKDLLDKFVAAGGTILVCAPCMKLRGIDAENLIAGAQPAGGATLVELLSQGAACVSY
jgi:predicted peroxiredoxin